MFSASILGLNAQLEAAYGGPRSIQAYFGYSFVQQSFIPTVREDERDRVYIREQKLGPGFRTILSRRLLVESQIGWSFDRSVYVGSSTLRRSADSTTLDSGWFGNLSAKYLF